MRNLLEQHKTMNQLKGDFKQIETGSEKEIEYFSNKMFVKAKEGKFGFSFGNAVGDSFGNARAILREFDDKFSLFDEKHEEPKHNIETATGEVTALCNQANSSNYISDIISTSKQNIFLPPSIWNEVETSTQQKQNSWFTDVNMKKYNELIEFTDYNLLYKTCFVSVFHKMQVGYVYHCNNYSTSLVKLNLNYTENRHVICERKHGEASY